TYTPVPHAPPVVCGCVNLRGDIYLVLDLRRLLGLPPIAVTPDTRLVIFKPAAGESFGVLVDAVGDIVTLDGDETEAWQPEGPGGELVAGIGKLDGELLVIVDAHKLLGAVTALLLPSPPGGEGSKAPPLPQGARGEKPPPHPRPLSPEAGARGEKRQP